MLSFVISLRDSNIRSSIIFSVSKIDINLPEVVERKLSTIVDFHRNHHEEGRADGWDGSFGLAKPRAKFSKVSI